MRKLKRIKVFSIEEVEAIVKEEVVNSDCSKLEKKNGESVVIEGYDVYKRSMRYKTFIEKGYQCVCCGRTGAYYALECNEGSNQKRAHFNLYSDDDVLMTKDHIFPKSKGGKNTIENMQTMCTICNSNKGSDVPENCSADLCNLNKQKKISNGQYIWRGDKKYTSIFHAANAIARGDKKGITTIKKRIRNSIKNGTVYCGVVWRYGKAMDV